MAYPDQPTSSGLVKTFGATSALDGVNGGQPPGAQALPLVAGRDRQPSWAFRLVGPVVGSRPTASADLALRLRGEPRSGQSAPEGVDVKTAQALLGRSNAQLTIGPSARPGRRGHSAVTRVGAEGVEPPTSALKVAQGPRLRRPAAHVQASCTMETA